MKATPSTEGPPPLTITIRPSRLAVGGALISALLLSAVLALTYIPTFANYGRPDEPGGDSGRGAEAMRPHDDLDADEDADGEEDDGEKNKDEDEEDVEEGDDDGSRGKDDERFGQGRKGGRSTQSISKRKMGAVTIVEWAGEASERVARRDHAAGVAPPYCSESMAVAVTGERSRASHSLSRAASGRCPRIHSDISPDDNAVGRSTSTEDDDSNSDATVASFSTPR